MGGAGQLLHDEVPIHLLGVDVATEVVGAGIGWCCKVVGGRCRAGDGLALEDALARG